MPSEHARGRARRAAPRRRAPKTRSTSAILGLTLLGALLPGTAYLAAGWKKLGALMLTVTIGLISVGGYLALKRREELIGLAVSPDKLRYVTIGLCLLGAIWILVIITSHRALRPGTASPGSRFIGAVFVGGLSFAVAVPTAMGIQTAATQRDLVQTVFMRQ